MIVPAMNAPNRACMPMASVMNDDTSNTRRITARNDLLIPFSGLYLASSFFRSGRTAFNMNTTYPTANSIVYTELSTDPAFTMAITTANRHQAVISSAAAQVMAIAPKRLFLHSPFLYDTG